MQIQFSWCYCLGGIFQSLSLRPYPTFRVMVQGAGPSARYAHTLALVANRFLVAMGGNDGKATLSDAWALDTSDKPYQWRKITEAGDTPSARCSLRPSWLMWQQMHCVACTQTCIGMTGRPCHLHAAFCEPA